MILTRSSAEIASHMNPKQTNSTKFHLHFPAYAMAILLLYLFRHNKSKVWVEFVAEISAENHL